MRISTPPTTAPQSSQRAPNAQGAGVARPGRLALASVLLALVLVVATIVATIAWVDGHRGLATDRAVQPVGPAAGPAPDSPPRVASSEPRTAALAAPSPDLSGVALIAGGVALLASIAGWVRTTRRARRATRTIGELRAELRQTRALADERQRQLNVVESLTGWIFWESDAHGRMRAAARAPANGPARRTPSDQPSRLRAWLQGADAAHALCADPLPIAARAGAHREFAATRARTADGALIEIESCATTCIDERGVPAGQCGLVRERQPATRQEYVERLGLAALAGVPVPAVLLQAVVTGGSRRWRLVWSNAAANAQTGRSQPELADADPANWLVPDADDPVMLDRPNTPSDDRLVHVLAYARPMQCRGELVDRFGVRRPALISVEPLDASGQESLRLVVVDVRPLELERLRQLAVVVESARRREAARSLELEVTARELESFSYTVSHDLRAPIRFIQGFAQALSDEVGAQLDDAARLHLRRILVATDRMSAMIDALLDLSRISAQAVVPHPVDLSAVGRAIVGDLRAQDPERRVDVAIADGLVAKGDPVLLRIALENLLRNAWKFTSRTPAAKIRFDAREIDGVVTYRVVDNGAGFDMCLASRLFGVFQRLHGSSEFPGTGVGLATVQRIVRRHGGRVWAESQPGMGARFMFTLWDAEPAKPLA